MDVSLDELTPFDLPGDAVTDVLSPSKLPLRDGERRREFARKQAARLHGR